MVFIQMIKCMEELFDIWRWRVFHSCVMKLFQAHINMFNIISTVYIEFKAPNQYLENQRQLE